MNENTVYCCFRDMMALYRKNKNDKTNICSQAFYLMKQDPENRFEPDTEEYNTFETMRMYYAASQRSGVGNKFNSRRFDNEVLHFCSLKPKNHYKYDKELAKREEAAAEKAEAERVKAEEAEMQKRAEAEAARIVKEEQQKAEQQKVREEQEAQERAVAEAKQKKYDEMLESALEQKRVEAEKARREREEAERKAEEERLLEEEARKYIEQQRQKEQKVQKIEQVPKRIFGVIPEKKGWFKSLFKKSGAEDESTGTD